MRWKTNRNVLIEAAAGAWRPKRPDGTIEFHPAWYDLDDAGRREAYELANASRVLEAALDPDGLSTTGRVVLNRVKEESGS